MDADAELLERINRLNRIGIALSSYRDTPQLLETILDNARALTGADGGTLYLVAHNQVSFEIVQTESLGIRLGGATGEPITFAPLELEIDGEPNRSAVVTSCINDARTINIADIRAETGYDFSGARKFDAQTGYETRSLLAVPMRDHEGRVIGALQLINALDAHGSVVAFSDESRQLLESLASQAAVALTNKRLIDGLRELFESFVRLIADAIDEKSPYTGAHCRRVPAITLLLADAAHRDGQGDLADFRLDSTERYALEIAAWLHDCGKITTPEHVMDKSTKLETIRDGVEMVATRFAVCQAELRARRDRLREEAERADDAGERQRVEAWYETERERLDGDLAFVRRVNAGSEFMREEDRERVRDLARRTWTDADGREQPLLTESEVDNLCIERGTLNDEERRIIENHAAVSIRMLEQLPFPRSLANVPEYAGGHHERVDGAGYPRGLTREEMSVPARAMAIGDIFEALSAHDRPYKEPRPLSECLRIMGHMCEAGHIDPDLFRVFVDHGVYREYAERYLDPAQIDAIDIAAIPGYAPGEKVNPD